MDIESAERRANKTVPFWPGLDDVRARAIINMSFNLGMRLGGFVQFIEALRHADWITAGKELEDSAWWVEVGARAPRIRKAIEVGGG
jgi:lysozyme